MGLRAGGRGRERRLWPEGREAWTVGSSGACCTAPEVTGEAADVGGGGGERERRREPVLRVWTH
uniref:Uncharacterized protein n=1 Tax=Triticum urartu TaxID=4572 RepID=A0A8R7Q302_TRIUA